ncbi:DUF4352 domain-containing protein [Shimazuella kribbensis]|uniref:DUF4352 domain-containing protein n=1 Tax=Shimazuella kribbensis TaxID=139808 RepID=UPI00041264D0|nr:DUF4352 domain-containing protein [Shimazuella kribbensis]
MNKDISKTVIKLIVLLLLFIGGVALVIWGWNKLDEPAAIKLNGTSQQTEQPENQVFRIGDTVGVKLPKDTGTMDFTISKQEIINVDPAYNPTGKVLKLVITLVNNSGRVKYESKIADFRLIDNEGNILKKADLPDMPSYDGELNIGKKLTGFIAFEVTGKEKYYKLVFSPSTFPREEVQWRLINK